MTSKRRVWDRLTEVVGSRYAALLAVLLAHLVLFSFLDRHPALRWLFLVTLVALVGSAVHAISGMRWVRGFVLLIGLAGPALDAASRELGVGFLHPYGLLAKALTFGIVIVVIFRDLLHRRKVDMDAILGACCVYLLMGLGWESVYSWVEWTIPGSFDLPVGPAAPPGPHSGVAPQSDLLYFSLITMTTVGYGDITPVTPPARIFSALEGLVAQLYLAIIIARLVGMELADRTGRAPRER